MKSATYPVIAALLGLTSALDTIVGEFQVSENGCNQCIRSGNVFCSDSFYTSGATIPGVNTCCDKTKPLDEINCPLAFSALNTKKAGFQCNDDFADLDRMVMACPQSTDICGLSPNNVFADTTTEKVDISVKNFRNKYSCTYITKATCGAPGFQRFKIDNPEFYTVHWMEYNGNTAMQDAFHPSIDSAANAGFDLVHVYDGNQATSEMGLMSHKVNISDTFLNYVPGLKIYEDLEAYKLEITQYNDAKTAYDLKKTLYDT